MHSYALFIYYIQVTYPPLTILYMIYSIFFLSISYTFNDYLSNIRPSCNECLLFYTGIPLISYCDNLIRLYYFFYTIPPASFLYNFFFLFSFPLPVLAAAPDMLLPFPYHLIYYIYLYIILSLFPTFPFSLLIDICPCK